MKWVGWWVFRFPVRTPPSRGTTMNKQSRYYCLHLKFLTFSVSMIISQFGTKDFDVDSLIINDDQSMHVLSHCVPHYMNTHDFPPIDIITMSVTQKHRQTHTHIHTQPDKHIHI